VSEPLDAVDSRRDPREPLRTDWHSGRGDRRSSKCVASAGASPIMSSSSPTWMCSPRSSPGSPANKHWSNSSAVSDHDLAKMTTTLEMPVRLFRLRRETSGRSRGASDGRNGPVHCLEISAASDAERGERNAAAVNNRGSSPVPDGDRLASIRLICPPTANVCSDVAIVPGPPISTTQSTPRPSVSSRTFAPQSGVSA
jgi:hypothetical protein